MIKEAREVPIPKKMQTLEKDPRGYPIPYIILRDPQGNHHFAVNDSVRQRKALVEKRCPICGKKLDKILWFVGGTLSAFDPNGAYMDTAMHYVCMEYALKVCPYLAAPQYLGEIAAEKAARKANMPSEMFQENTMIPGRPKNDLFVAVASLRQSISFNSMRPAHVIPRRPYIAIEYWRHGVRIPDEVGQAEAERILGVEKILGI